MNQSTDTEVFDEILSLYFAQAELNRQKKAAPGRYTWCLDMMERNMEIYYHQMIQYIPDSHLAAIHEVLSPRIKETDVLSEFLHRAVTNIIRLHQRTWAFIIK